MNDQNKIILNKMISTFGKAEFKQIMLNQFSYIQTAGGLFSFLMFSILMLIS